ncbi:MAG: DUF3793 domain-containing protein [Lachnoclostridium sp.]|jgi:hypothetical protein
MSDDIFNIRGDKVTSYVVFTFANSCMPTLLKSKPSSLISFHKKYMDDDINLFFRILQKECRQFDCSYEVLYENDYTIYVFIYQEDLLKEVLNKHSDNPILSDKGYRKGQESFQYNLCHFKRRYRNFQERKEAGFPHEVGIFLGYPIFDVEEYIRNKGENYMLCGYWKVYHDVENAARTFQYFKKLREEAMDLFFSGRELSEIVLSA